MRGMRSNFFALIVLMLVAACTAPTASPSPTAPPSASATPASTTVAVEPFTTRQQFRLRDLPGAGRYPIALAMLDDKLYALNSVSQNLAVIQNDRVIKFIALNARPHALVADPNEKRLYVASEDKTITLIADDQIQLTENIGEASRALLFFENQLYVGLDSRNGIRVLDPATLATRASIAIPNSFTIISLAGDEVHHRVYANAYEKIAVIDSLTRRVVTTFDTKGSYQTLLANPRGENVLVGIYDSQTQTQHLTAFDPLAGKPGARVQLGGDPRAALISADGARAYIANSYTNDVSVIDPRTMTTVATIPVGMKPWSLALAESARRLYVANYESDNVIAINTDTHQVVATIPLAMLPTALAANERAGRVYIANGSTDSVFVVEGARVVKEIPVGRHPIDLVYDAPANRVLVAHQADRTLAIIDDATFAVRATQPITRFVTTVETDPAKSRVFVNDVILDANSLAPIGALTMRGITIGSLIAPTFIRVNPNTNRVYANGGNGVPGSNGRHVTYSIDGDTLGQRTMLGYAGNTSAFTIDPQTNRVFLAGTHPLAYSNELTVFDANDQKIFALVLPARTRGMIFNPQTRHLFLAHADSMVSGGLRPAPADNTIQILDTDSFGQVASISINAPSKMARLGNTIYIAASDGTISVIQDAPAPRPPAPTPTFTPTAYPTLQPLTPRPTITPRPISAAALQGFQRGTMFANEKNQPILIFGDGTWE